jgi:hypothetical protein
MRSEDIAPSIKLFASIARKYCVWAESKLRQSQEEMQNARQLLAELHLALTSLPPLPSCLLPTAAHGCPLNLCAPATDRVGA